jgi:hypothetical protein
MAFLKYTLITLVTLVLIGSACYLLASGGMQSKPGYTKLDLPSWLSTNTTVALNLGPRGLKPVRWMVKRVIKASDHQSELSGKLITSVMQDLQGLQLRLYEVENNRPVFEQAIDDSIVTLREDGWLTLLSVREDNKRVVVMQAEDKGLISGVSVLAITPENAIFVNLVGQLTPESIAIIAEGLDPSNQPNLF